MRKKAKPSVTTRERTIEQRFSGLKAGTLPRTDAFTYAGYHAPAKRQSVEVRPQEKGSRLHSPGPEILLDGFAAAFPTNVREGVPDDEPDQVVH